MGKCHGKIQKRKSYQLKIPLWRPIAASLPLPQKGEAASRLRNPAIVEVVDKLGGYIEKIGSGVRRMIDAMIDHNLEPPQFKLDGDILKVTLCGPGERFMELAQKSIPEEWLKEMNERQIKAIRYLQEKEKITNREYRDLCEVGSDTAHRDLSDLVQRGILKREGKGSATYYRMVIG